MMYARDALCQEDAVQLMCAVQDGDTANARRLLEKDVDADTVIDSQGTSLLMWAVQHGLAALQWAMAVAAGVVNEEGRLALRSAAQHKHVEMVGLLLEKGANVHTVIDSRGTSILTWAVRNRHTSIVRLLLQKGAVVGAADHAGIQALLPDDQYGFVAPLFRGYR